MIHGNHPPRLFDYAFSPVLPTPAALQPAETAQATPPLPSKPAPQSDHGQPLRRSRRDATLHYEVAGESGLTVVPLRSTPLTTLSTHQPATAPRSPDITANTVAHQFAERPTLRSVVSGMLSDALKNLYPTLAFDLEYTSLAEPTSDNPPQYCLTPLLDVALKHLTSDGELDFTDKHSLACTLIDQATGHTLKPAPSAQGLTPGIDMQAVELVIRSLRTTLKSEFEHALIRHFTGDDYNAQDTGAAGANRWLWLSDALRDTLRSAALKQRGLT